jgi:hypothetical protein
VAVAPRAPRAGRRSRPVREPAGPSNGPTEQAKAAAWWAGLSDDERAELRELGQDHLPTWAVDGLRGAGVTLTVDRYWPSEPGEPDRYPLPGVLRDIVRSERG